MAAAAVHVQLPQNLSAQLPRQHQSPSSNPLTELSEFIAL